MLNLSATENAGPREEAQMLSLGQEGQLDGAFGQIVFLEAE